MKNKKYILKLTKKQLDVVTTCLFEWTGLCEGEWQDCDGNSLPRHKKELKYMNSVLDTIRTQMNNQERLVSSVKRPTYLKIQIPQSELKRINKEYKGK